MNFLTFSITNLFILSFKTTVKKREKTMINHLPSFKGYDAVPLKSIYIDFAHGFPIREEMSDICKQENISLRKVFDGCEWAQDNKCIVQRNGKPYMIGGHDLSSDTIDIMEHNYGISGNWEHAFLTGGNTFIGKFPNGDKWLITGAKVFPEKIKDIAKCYDVKEENIHQIPTPDFHIDLGIRPIGYPDILVNDPEIAEKNLEKLNDGSKEFEEFKSSFKAYQEGAKITYASADAICDALKKIGFNPIRVGGVYYNGVNFMNAIVNKHPDGTMGYITNSSECNNHIYTKLQKVFEDEIREKAPQITDFYYVQGIRKSPYRPPTGKNHMIDSLKYYHGGIHCMSLEEPDFDKWA